MRDRSFHLAALELAQLYYANCQIPLAIEKFSEASSLSLQADDFEAYSKCQVKLLRLYAEHEDTNAVQSTIDQLLHLSRQDGVPLSSRLHHAIGLCAIYQQRFADARVSFQTALSLALAGHDQEDMSYALYGLVYAHWCLGRHEEALRELRGLQIVLQFAPAHELHLSSRMTEASILNDLKKHQDALDILWACYDEVDCVKNLYTHSVLMYSLAKTYFLLGQGERAQIYLELAKKMTDPKNLVNLARSIRQLEQDFTVAQSDTNYDLVFDSHASTVTVRDKGRIEMKNQFVLLDLLRLLTNQPGHVFTKEALVENVWKESYDPGIHDNKIYVTIKRLRKLIEPDYKKPRYLLRADGGYFFNPRLTLRCTNPASDFKKEIS